MTKSINSLKVFIHVPCQICHRASRIAAELSHQGFDVEVIICNRGNGPERKKEYSLRSELAFIILSPEKKVIKLYEGQVPNIRRLAKELTSK